MSHALLVAISASSARRIGEVAFVVGAVGALLIAVGGWSRPDAATAGRTPTDRIAILVGGLLLALCCVLEIVHIHWA